MSEYYKALALADEIEWFFLAALKGETQSKVLEIKVRNMRLFAVLSKHDTNVE